MPRDVPGVLELSYARSAGSGDQPVPGLVTSRRDRGKQQRQRLQQQQKEEEDRQQKEREKVAKLLKRKWAEEDRDRAERRKKGVSEAATDEAEAPGKSRDKDRGRTDGSPSAGPRPRRTFREADGDRSDAGAASLASSADAAGGWQASAGSRATEPLAPPAAAGGWSSSSTGTPAFSALYETQAPSRMRQDSKASRKAAPVLAGFGLDDDDEDASRRELDLLAEKQRVRAEKSAGLATGESRGAASFSGHGQTVDAYAQLKKLADWKRSCGGERRPMPREMIAELAQVAEKQGGHNV